jgi:hypothetical protein
MTLFRLPILLVSCLLTSLVGEVKFSTKSDYYTIGLKDIGKITASASAVFSADGKNFRIGTKDLPFNGEARTTQAVTPFGKATQTDLQYGSLDAPYQLTLRIKELNDLNAITIQGFLHNRSGQDLNLNSLEILDAMSGSGKVELGNSSDWLITPLMQHNHAETLEVMNGGCNEVGLFVNTINHKSFLIGPAGPADAHCRVEVRDQKFKAYAQMDRVLVSPGETRRSEEILLIAEDTETNIDIWTRWVAIHAQGTK